MWFEFALCSILLVAVLYIPGFLFCRALQMDAPYALACAPVPSIAAYALLPVLYGLLGISCTWANVVLPAAILFLVCRFVFGRYSKHRSNVPSLSRRESREIWGVLALYLLIGLAICVYLFVSSLDGASSFHPKHDNMTHYNNIRAFLDSGIWSSLATSKFMGTGLSTASYQGVSFYPSAWHDLTAILCSALNCEVAVAVNATNAIVIGVVCPLSTFAFIRALFPNRTLVLIAGAFVSLAFTAFPWAFLIKGPLYPNLLANALIPAALSAVMQLITGRFETSKYRFLFGILFGLASFIALALSQTNSLFTVLVFLMFYCTPLLRDAVFPRIGQPLSKTKLKTAAFYLIYSVVAIIVWAASTSLPFLKGVIAYDNVGDASLGVFSGAFSTVSFSFIASLPQWSLVIASLAGALILIVRRKGWLVALAALMLFCYFISRFMLGYPKAFLTGVWYNDPWRLAACAAQFLTPLASVGLAGFIGLTAKSLQYALCPLEGDTPLPAQCLSVSAIGVLLVFSCWTFFPTYNEPHSNTYTHPTAFGQVRYSLESFYTRNVEQVYSDDEQVFVREALAVIPEDAVVINQPNDGSAFAYGLDGLNTYYRNNPSYGLTDEAETILKGLDNISEDEHVRDAIASVNGEYVLLLDQGVSWEDGVWMNEYRESTVHNWDGINNITDETPGFEVLLADGDMRLYKIVG